MNEKSIRAKKVKGPEAIRSSQLDRDQFGRNRAYSDTELVARWVTGNRTKAKIWPGRRTSKLD